VDLQEKRQLDLAAQVTRVKTHARPWRAIIAGLLAIVCGILSWHAGQHFSEYFGTGPLGSKVVAATAAAATCLFGVVAVLDFGSRTRDVQRPDRGNRDRNRHHLPAARYRGRPAASAEFPGSLGGGGIGQAGPGRTGWGARPGHAAGTARAARIGPATRGATRRAGRAAPAGWLTGPAVSGGRCRSGQPPQPGSGRDRSP